MLFYVISSCVTWRMSERKHAQFEIDWKQPDTFILSEKQYAAAFCEVSFSTLVSKWKISCLLHPHQHINVVNVADKSLMCGFN